ncbi:hypothetical protein CVT25_010841 [Psilocybe cyanescens]|uniref:MARVEL domain-containing protein n=1 Tax=Psilocybe cyanescens TaxID=93625 RepID=A0A409WF74_PSICY|nr:hypothetical protein CVT25_010841 [Psilocybe cyanescens]
MIINTPDVDDNVDSSDAASTNTLVSNEQKIPSYLLVLVCVSLVMSTLAFIFSVVNNVQDTNIVSDGVVATILAFIFTLPHHGATVLLTWLQHHEMASILKFTPFSTRAIGYSIVLVIVWVVSTAVCARNINYILIFEPYDVDQSLVAAIAISTIEMILIIAITSICYLHYRRQNMTRQPPPFPSTLQSGSKVVQV